MGKFRVETAGRAIEFEIEVAQTAMEDRSTEDEIRATLNRANDGQRALEPLIKALKDESRLSNQLAALRVLQSLHEQNVDVSPAYEVIAECVKQGQPALANAAGEALSRLGPDAVRWLMKHIEDNPQEAPDRLCEIIARHADQQDLVVFIQAGVHSPDPHRRHKTASTIDELFVSRPESAGQAMVEILYQLQTDPIGFVRTTASMGLARAPETVDVDFGRLIQHLNWEDDPFMAFGPVFRMIGAQRRRAWPAIPALLALRQNPPPGPYPSPKEVRLNATNALCMIDPEGIGDYLRELVDIEGAVTCEEILVMLEGDLPVELLREWMADKRPTVVETAIATAAVNGAMGVELAPEITQFLQGG